MSEQLTMDFGAKKPVARCGSCGAKTVEYNHSFNRPLAQGLFALNRVGGTANLKELGLTHNQWENFQKLRYWGLVEKHFEDGKRVGGSWVVTQKGFDFVRGLTTIPRTVWTYRGDTVRFEGPECAVSDELPAACQKYDEYPESPVGPE